MAEKITLRDIYLLAGHGDYIPINVHDVSMPSFKTLIWENSPNAIMEREVASISLSRTPAFEGLGVELVPLPKDTDPKYRVCSICHMAIDEGYVYENGLDYYCSPVCLHKHFTGEEWEQAYEREEGYWTTWYE